MQIAIYGKGGIGKSTISANLSAALAKGGSHVLQIGCDPKHDSTRLLHHGKKVRTVLDYILNTPEDDQKASDILMHGYAGSGCVEAGGPKPGMGCAGRGILTSFDFLNKHSVFKDYDTIVYDVLGDVVCGGFAVPARTQYAEAIFIVTSGEAMAIYAANNILQGIKNLDKGTNRIAGIIYNSRGKGDEEERVEAFSAAVGLPICAKVPRSEAFMRAERAAVTVVEAGSDSPEAQVFIRLAEKIQNGLKLYPSDPLSEEQMELFMQGKSIAAAVSKEHPAQKIDTECIECGQSENGVSKNTAQIHPLSKKRALSDPFSRMPLFGCAYRGAMDLAVQIKDACVLGHAPKSCTSYTVNGVTSYGRTGLFARGVIYPAFIPQHYDNTDINIHDAVFGGAEHFRKKALALAEKGARDIIAVTACIPGLSGDDLEPVKKELKSLGTNLYIVKADGVEEGSYNEGMALCYKTLAKEAVGPAEDIDRDSINLVYELSWSLKTQDNYEKLSEIFHALGIKVNCRFLYDCSIKDVKGFLRAPYSLLARCDKLGLEIKSIFENKYGCRFIKESAPMGFKESEIFAKKLGELYSKENEAARLIEKFRKLYDAEIKDLRECFEGKSVMIFLSSPNSWLMDLAKDLKLNIVGVFLPEKDERKDPTWRHRFSKEWEGDVSRFIGGVKEKKPDIVIASDNSVLNEAEAAGCEWNIFAGRDIGVGFLSAAQEAKRWQRMSGKKLKGRWKNDKSVFEKYYC